MASFNCRGSKIRRAIMAIFIENKKPLSVPDFMLLLKDKHFSTINKTTVYRQLKFLLDKQVITGIEIAGSKHYQLSHQHPQGILFCTRCQNVIPLKEEFKMPTIKNNFNFKINHFSMLFFGLCQKCQKDKTSKV